eukprot:CAMPEP_0114629688 /NCGR_PEP_ID=MMETSP0168-20121206/13492_1 /TAXON_ID=95228 ORGANISM="Vannella sp., Strain DIVA3 517/6/12" /NCGR_SAMPLE_ID=MMETSP0168 /ASSEMBLY_ACC=CAM_ASM_000044 /LENGTH=58 /DNA_ID=CAMNT_0001841163 /DNA_START=27 /DNA_END=199 /DNA_ORIENTATION=+
MASPVIVKPKLDERTYEHRTVALKGPKDSQEAVSLRCLFVQDLKTEKAAASMCVHVGA